MLLRKRGKFWVLLIDGSQKSSAETPVVMVQVGNNIRQVRFIHKIVRHRNCIVEIEDAVPPSTGNINQLAGMNNTLDKST